MELERGYTPTGYFFCPSKLHLTVKTRRSEPVNHAKESGLITNCFSVKNIILATLLIALSGCTTYRSEFIVPSDKTISEYNYIYVDPENPKLEFPALDPSDGQKYEYVSFNPLIENMFLEQGFTPIQSLQGLSKPDRLKTAVVQWRKTDTIPNVLGGYSVEITILVTDLVSKEIVYQGLGDHRGATETGDHEGAITAALEGLSDAKAGLKGKKTDERWKPVSQ